MKNTSKTLGSISIAAALSLFFAAATPLSAQAELFSLYYNQFKATPEFAQLAAAEATNAQQVASLDGMDMTMNFSSGIVGLTLASMRAEVATTRNESWAHVSKLDKNGNITAVQANYYYGLGKYIQELDDFQTSDNKIANIQNVLDRLNKSSANSVSDSTSAMPEEFDDIKPSNLFASATEGISASSALNDPGVYFTNITVSPVSNDAGSTNYTFRTSKPVGTNGNFLKVTYSETFNYLGYLTSFVFDESDDLNTVGLHFDVTQSAHNGLKVFVPQPKVTVDQTQLIAMGHQIEAEKLVTPKANSIAAVAKSLAKSSHSTLAVKHLTGAAKALGAKITSIKNGVKLTAKVSKVAGSMCVTIAKGKTAVNHC